MGASQKADFVKFWFEILKIHENIGQIKAIHNRSSRELVRRSFKVTKIKSQKQSLKYTLYYINELASSEN